jgi:hypothetical protein
MEDAQRTYSHEDEVKRMYENIGDEGIDSNGHGEGEEESMNLVMTIIFCKRTSKVIKLVMIGL